MKPAIAVIFGGRSPEHWVSLKSGLFVISLLHDSPYRAVPVYLDQQGHLSNSDQFATAVNEFFTSSVPLYEQHDGVSPDWIEAMFVEHRKSVAMYRSFLQFLRDRSCQLLFPVFHGRYGEDGTIQGLAEFFSYPYAGCNLSGSALGIDKALTKETVASQGLPVAVGVDIRSEFWRHDKKAWAKHLQKRLSLPFFIKPARLGSSIGIQKVTVPEEIIPAIDAAFEWDHRLIVEQQVEAIEYSIGVMGREGRYQVSAVSESTLSPDYFDYNAKYADDAPDDIVPARLSPQESKKLQDFALQCFRALAMEGWCRVDIFAGPNGFILNEVNTMPGLSAHAPFVKAWEHAGKSKRQLLVDAIQLGFELGPASAMRGE